MPHEFNKEREKKKNTKQQPQLIVINQQLFCKSFEGKQHFDELLLQFELQSEEQQAHIWNNYWRVEGVQFALEQWKLKYSDYLAEPIESIDCEQCSNIATKVSNDDEEYKSWLELWEKHTEEIYCAQYMLFDNIYKQYYSDFKTALQNEIQQNSNTLEEEEENNKVLIVDWQIEDEIEKLQLLGLPVAFGSHKNQTKKGKIKKPIEYNFDIFENFCDLFNEKENDIDIEASSSNSNLSDMMAADDDEEHCLHTLQPTSAIAKAKQKLQNRKLRNIPEFIREDKALLKYWRRRFSLFSRFDEGIRLDRESWFSVTPEKVAIHLAQRLACDILVDGFCGSGGNAIQFAKTCRQVIAIDIDPQKIEMAKHNAAIYGVAERIQFIVGDFFHLSSERLRGDIVFLSPPWGGPKYKSKQDYDLEKFLLPAPASELVACARHVSDNIALYIPRNSNLQQIIKMAGVGQQCEIEHNYLDTRLVAITAFYGESIVKKAEETE